MSGTYERKDALYEQAKQDGYRSRAAYKLLEIDKKFGLLKKGGTVVDLGCFPGGWLQIAAKKLGASGRVVGIDLVPVAPVASRSNEAPVSIIEGDAGSEENQRLILELAGGKVSLVLSDMSPQLTGIRFRDAARSAELVELAAAIASQLLEPGGAFVAKIFPGSESDAIFQTIRGSYQSFTRHVLKSSRKTSNEYYFVGRGFGMREKK